MCSQLESLGIKPVPTRLLQLMPTEGHRWHAPLPLVPVLPPPSHPQHCTHLLIKQLAGILLDEIQVLHLAG